MLNVQKLATIEDDVTATLDMANLTPRELQIIQITAEATEARVKWDMWYKADEYPVTDGRVS